MNISEHAHAHSRFISALRFRRAESRPHASCPCILNARSAIQWLFAFCIGTIMLHYNWEMQLLRRDSSQIQLEIAIVNVPILFPKQQSKQSCINDAFE